jgi:DNA (cytosine-5)-methyltransferase 1
MTSPLVLSLFPGVGLFDLAFEREGFCVVRGPDPLWGGDVRVFHPTRERFDGVIGGPPCQIFSGLANLQRGKGQEPSFGDLIPEFERCVHESAPAWFVMENVRTAPIPAVRGYVVDSRLVQNRWFGEEQSRIRRFSFGTAVGHRLQIVGEVFMNPIFAQTVTAAHAGERRIHGKKATGGAIVRYSLEESARLQGVPIEQFERCPFRREALHKMLANGVPLPMGRAIAQAVKRAMGYDMPTAEVA